MTMDSPTDQEQGTPSPSTSDIENYTRDLLERARTRSKLIDGQVPLPLKERPLPKAPAAKDEAPVVCQDKNSDEQKRSETDEEEDTEEDVSAEIEEKQDTLKSTRQHSTAKPPSAGEGHSEASFKTTTRSSRLTMLARTINEWEDDLTHAPVVGNRSVAAVAEAEKRPRSPAVSTPPPPALALVSPPKSPVKIFTEKTGPMLGGPRSPSRAMSPKQVQFAQSPPKQIQPPAGRALSPPKQIQRIQSPTGRAQSPPKQIQPKSPPKQVQPITSPPKQNRIIEKSPSKAALEPNPETGRDPCSVIRPGTVSQNRLLFEPAGGRPIERCQLNIVKGTVQDRKLAFEKGNVGRAPSPVNRAPSPVRIELVQEGTRTINKLFGSAAASKDTLPVAPSPPPMPAPAPKRPHSPTSTTPNNANYPGLSGLKKLRPTPSPPKPGHLYPSLTDIEDTEQEVDMDDSGESLGCVIEKVAKSATATPVQMHGQDRDNTCTVTMAIGSALDALDDALEGEDYTLDTVMESQLHAQASSTPNTAVGSSTQDVDLSGSGNDSYRSGPGYLETDIDAVLGIGRDAEEFEQGGPKAVGLEPSSGSGEDPTITSSPIIRAAPSTVPVTTPLMHTVSFYRRSQQQQTPSAGSSSKTATRKQLVLQEEQESDDEEQENERVNEEIRELEMQVVATTKSIAQASKALNLCNTSVEFSDSTERVECERVLLLATNRRSALLTHIQNLRTEAVLGRTAYFSTATLSMGQIRIQAPRGSSSSRNNPQMMRVHHHVLLARCAQNVEASEVVQREQDETDGHGVLDFKGFRLQGLNKDFRLVMELYGMETGREWLSHDAKYRIASSGKKGTTLTPSKKQHLHLQSPAGPQAVLSPTFALQGSLTLTIGDLRKKQFQMTTSSNSGSGWGLALETEIQATATCSVRHTGYLALFEDVNGLGCWVRRWAVLGGGLIQFWMYEADAEDENKPPSTTISLTSVTTSTVRPPAPSVCARANSIFMESVRDRRTSDKPSLTTELSGSITRVKWLLAADSKEERAEWLDRLNTVLEEHRRWQ